MPCPVPKQSLANKNKQEFLSFASIVRTDANITKAFSLYVCIYIKLFLAFTQKQPLRW